MRVREEKKELQRRRAAVKKRSGGSKEEVETRNTKPKKLHFLCSQLFRSLRLFFFDLHRARTGATLYYLSCAAMASDDECPDGKRERERNWTPLLRFGIIDGVARGKKKTTLSLLRFTCCASRTVTLSCVKEAGMESLAAKRSQFGGKKVR